MVLDRVLVRVIEGGQIGAGYGYAPQGIGDGATVWVPVRLGVDVLVEVLVAVAVYDRVGDRRPAAAY